MVVVVGFVHGQWLIGVDEVHDVHHCNWLSCAGQYGFQGCVSLLAVTFRVEDGETRWLKKKGLEKKQTNI